MVQSSPDVVLEAAAPPTAAQGDAARGRLACLDALRGAAILAIIGLDGAVASFGEMAKSGPPLFREICAFLALQFSHVAWEGLHVYDFVFPLFVFITGAGIAFSIPRALKTHGRAAVYAKVLRRSLILYALGILYYVGVGLHWEDIRYVGVLQRIAICYLATSILFVHFRAGALALVAASILLLYWAVMNFVPAPGIPAGSFEPENNLADWIDRTYLPGRLWNGASDPEGLLSTAPAIATCISGALAGIHLRAPLAPQRASVALVIGGAILVAVGLLWGLSFPIIKSLWTSSFVLVTAGASAMLLGAVHEALDVRRAASASWLVWVGANAITLYMLAGVGLFEAVAMGLAGNVAAALDARTVAGAGAFLIHAIGLALAILLAGFLFRKRLLIRI